MAGAPTSYDPLVVHEGRKGCGDEGYAERGAHGARGAVVEQGRQIIIQPRVTQAINHEVE